MSLIPETPRFLYQLGRAYLRSGAFRMANDYFERASGRGYAAASVDLGASHANGDGVRVNDCRANEWFKKAAAQGSADGHFRLGLNLIKGGCSRKHQCQEGLLLISQAMAEAIGQKNDEVFTEFDKISGALRGFCVARLFNRYVGSVVRPSRNH